MKNAKKVLLLVLCAALLVCATAAGTVAYLTDTKSVQNTFTVGNVTIDLQERNDPNFEDVIPDGTYEKEPVVTVKADSADCYVRAKVTVSVPSWGGTEDEFKTFATNFADAYIWHDEGKISQSGFNAVSWEQTSTAPTIGKNTIVYYLYYTSNSTKDVVESSTEDQPLPALFHDIHFPKELDKTTLPYLENMTIEVEAHAIQAGGFANATAAWLEFDSTP